MTSNENNSICACEEHLRAECRTERFFTNAEGKRYCLWHYPGIAVNADKQFVCASGILSNSACKSEPFFKSHEGKDYCVLHYPGADKLKRFHVALSKKLKEQDCNFHGVWFPDVVHFVNKSFSTLADFSSASFSGAAYFINSSFSAGADFSGANFSAEAIFSDTSFSAKADFIETRFSGVAEFKEASFSKVADFRGVGFNTEAYFCDAGFDAEANFTEASFTGKADFRKTNFSGEVYFSESSFSAEADFREAGFSTKAKFRKASFEMIANFGEASFNGPADFAIASFSAKAFFSGTSFGANADFDGASFGANADFEGASFGADADFISASFKDYARFSVTNEKKALGEKTRFDLQFAKFEKHERVLFHTLNLRPHAFINVDSRKFEFVDVDWQYELNEELKSAEENNVSATHRLLAIALRQLADNAEANHRYHEASRFRYNAFEVRRIEKFRGFVPWRLDWWYWLASGYGESVGRAALVFIVLLALFTFGYKSKYSEFIPAISTATPSATVMTQGDQPAAPEPAPKRLGWREAALYSFNVSLLQKPEPKPKGSWSSLLVALQTVLGPAQAALLALAVRRRFMR